jgi:hypothetical protein
MIYFDDAHVKGNAISLRYSQKLLSIVLVTDTPEDGLEVSRTSSYTNYIIKLCV